MSSPGQDSSVVARSAKGGIQHGKAVPDMCKAEYPDTGTIASHKAPSIPMAEGGFGPFHTQRRELLGSGGLFLMIS